MSLPLVRTHSPNPHSHNLPFKISPLCQGSSPCRGYFSFPTHFRGFFFSSEHIFSLLLSQRLPLINAKSLHSSLVLFNIFLNKTKAWKGSLGSLVSGNIIVTQNTGCSSECQRTWATSLELMYNSIPMFAECGHCSGQVAEKPSHILLSRLQPPQL